MKISARLCLFMSLCPLLVFASTFYACLDKEKELISSSDPLFVSLGAACEPALMLKFNDRRKAAFPFDWATSFDGDALVDLLNNNFQDFFHPAYCTIYNPWGHLLHTKYQMEFIHDGNFNINYERRIKNFTSKYQRRIDRFKSLNNYPGKVFFIRSVCITHIEEPRFYLPAADSDMSDTDAIKLFDALKYLFPNLNFELIVINCCAENSLQEEIKLGDRIRMLKADPYLELSARINNYNILFKRLANEAL
jgi:hypothetical protein